MTRFGLASTARDLTCLQCAPQPGLDSMKLVEFALRDTAPIKRLEVADLTDVVVFAGPNGVGKTRMLGALLTHFQDPTPHSSIRAKVVATTAAERELWKGADTLDTADRAQATILRSFLRRRQKRGELRGGVLNFDSSRSFERIKPYAWSWDFQDPFEEAIEWQQTYQPVRDRFQDVIHSMLRKVRSHKEGISDRAITLMAAGATSMPLELGDPLEKFKEAFARLLPGKTLLNLNQRTQDLQYQSGDSTLPFTSLSSGEREVVTIVFDFLLRDPHDCIVVFDEPELHLHPELSYRLLRTLREVGERNQFIFCTHSPDIITASLDQTVVFVAPVKEGANQAITVREDDATSRVLHLLGQSVGVISLGRRLVLIEGDRNSLDKQAYGAIAGTEYPELVLVPVGGKGAIGTFTSALGNVLNKALWGIDWFMLADGDSVAAIADSENVEARAGGRLRLLPRYHLENYFLDEDVLAAVFAYIDAPATSWLRDPSQIRDTLRELAVPMISYGAAVRVAQRFRANCGNVDLMPKGCHNLDAAALVAAFESKRVEESGRIKGALDPTTIARSVEAEFRILYDAVKADDNAWKRLLPGKPILNAFASKTKLEVGSLKRIYIRLAQGHVKDPFADIREIFAHFALYGSDSVESSAPTPSN